MAIYSEADITLLNGWANEVTATSVVEGSARILRCEMMSHIYGIVKNTSITGNLTVLSSLSGLAFEWFPTWGDVYLNAMLADVARSTVHPVLIQLDFSSNQLKVEPDSYAAISPAPIDVILYLNHRWLRY